MRTWHIKEGVDAKLQWCQLCEQKVLEVDPCRVRGTNHLIMVCPECRKAFEERQQCWWGKEQYQYYWDLGNIPIESSRKSATPRKWYVIELTKVQLAWLRAAGYELIKYKEKEK